MDEVEEAAWRFGLGLLSGAIAGLVLGVLALAGGAPIEVIPVSVVVTAVIVGIAWFLGIRM